MSLLGRLWRSLPPAARREALFSTMAALAPRPSPAPPPLPDARLPVTVAGYFGAPTGLGEGARRLADMLEAAGAEVVRADLTGPLRQGPKGPPPRVPEGPGTLLMHVNGPMLPWGMFALGRRAVAGKRVIGFWNWELPVLPADWGRGYRFVHGIWASSRFVAGAVARPGGGPPVAVVPYPVPDPDPAPLGRAAFGLPEGAFVALTVFDASSTPERKNPLAAIRAHAMAFGDRPDRLLVVKTHSTATAGPAWREVAEAAAAQPNVRLLDQEMTRAELWALERAADLFVSLHRSEGVGLSLAEAMRLGRPVLATGWSGNMDFMDAGSAALVGYRLVPAADARGVYSVPGAVWAEPDLGEAASWLRHLAEDPALRTGLAERGRDRVAGLTLPLCGRHALRLLLEGGGGGSPRGWTSAGRSPRPPPD